MLLAKRRGRDEFEARFLCPVWFYEFAGARDAAVSDRSAKRSLKIGAQASSRFARIGTPRTKPAGFMATDGVSRRGLGPRNDAKRSN